MSNAAFSLALNSNQPTTSAQAGMCYLLAGLCPSAEPPFIVSAAVADLARMLVLTKHQASEIIEELVMERMIYVERQPSGIVPTAYRLLFGKTPNSEDPIPY